jgi:GT2 family glycosyltransferase
VKGFVSSLKEQTYADYQLILVDDGCTDGTVDYVSDEIENLVVLSGDGNLWWAGCLEKARKHLLGQNNVRNEDIVLIANDDVTFDENFLAGVSKDIGDDPDSLIVAKVYDVKTREQRRKSKGTHIDWKSFKYLKTENPAEINVLSTRATYMKWGVFKMIGGFHTFLLPHYAADHEFTHRAFRKGFRLKISGHTRIYMNVQTTGVRNLNLDTGFIGLMRILFTDKKSIFNWFMLNSFVVLACEPKYIPINLLRVQLGTAGMLARWIARRIRKLF